MSWKNVQYENGKFKTGEGGGGGGSSTFAGLDDVNFSNLQNGQVPKYNSTTQKWENADESGGGGNVTDVKVDGVSVVNQQGVAEITMPAPPSVPDELSDLSDVHFSNLTDHQPLRYNATSQKWVNGADSYPPLIYSDEEREVGVWRDGKPLYQKVITTNNTTTGSWVAIDISALSIDTPCFWYGAFNRNIGGVEYWYLFDSREGGHDDVYSGTFRIDGENDTPNGRIFYKIKTFEGNNKQIFILQYTKTTDTAGSGTWTTQGGYAHHYSTAEHVIGTWIDGKPLYDKTFVGTTPSNSTPIAINHNIVNVKFIAEIKGVVDRGDGTSVPIEFARSTSIIWTQISQTAISIMVEPSDLHNKTFYLTLQYTKTSDA